MICVNLVDENNRKEMFGYLASIGGENKFKLKGIVGNYFYVRDGVVITNKIPPFNCEVYSSRCIYHDWEDSEYLLTSGPDYKYRKGKLEGVTDSSVDDQENYGDKGVYAMDVEKIGSVVVDEIKKDDYSTSNIFDHTPEDLGYNSDKEEGNYKSSYSYADELQNMKEDIDSLFKQANFGNDVADDVCENEVQMRKDIIIHLLEGM